MSWERELIDLYNKNEEIAGKIQEKKIKVDGKEKKIPYILAPVYHTIAEAGITITLREDGSFEEACTVYEDENLTVIPISIKSASRTSNYFPHPLCDQLRYLAKDFPKYVKDVKKKGKLEKAHKEYMDNLKQWKDSDFSHPVVEAVYRYLERGEIIRDLIAVKVLKPNSEEDLLKKGKKLIRFVIRNGINEIKCWEDKELQNKYIAYYNSINVAVGLDYLSGDIQSVTHLHPKNIIKHSAAKLISSNNEEVFCGRFADKEEALAIGWESSMKMHNALKWIIDKQGKQYGKLTLVAWESTMLDMPNYYDSSAVLFGGKEKKLAKEWNGDPETAWKFYRMLDGKQCKLSKENRMILIGINISSNGRLSLVEYKTIATTRYLANINKWHQECSWDQNGVPSIKEITAILYGVEERCEDDPSKFVLSIDSDNGKKKYQAVMKKLLPCLWDHAPIPYDLVSFTAEKASSPHNYIDRKNWEMAVSLACSFVKKYRYDRYREIWEIKVDYTCRDRNYLYGRLLAVADQIEKEAGDENIYAMTNAKKYMSSFIQRPYFTWGIIERQLRPYVNRLKTSKRIYYEKMMNEIFASFHKEDYRNKGRLSNLYLLGYSSQMYSFDKKVKLEETKIRDTSVDECCYDKSYLFGRLLAVADVIEESCLRQQSDNHNDLQNDSERIKEIDEKGDYRITNAKRYMVAFSQRPLDIWKIIEESIQPYINKLDDKNKKIYESLLNEIYKKLDVVTFRENTQLNPMYLLGYHNQCFDLYRKGRKLEIEENCYKKAVDENCEDRNYLYGRLLAIMDQIEKRGLFKGVNTSGIITNARKYMRSFAQSPYSTWKHLEVKIKPYFTRLDHNNKEYYQIFMKKINEQFISTEFEKNEKLNALYLLGYHHQMYEMQYKKLNEGGNEDE